MAWNIAGAEVDVTNKGVVTLKQKLTSPKYISSVYTHIWPIANENDKF